MSAPRLAIVLQEFTYSFHRFISRLSMALIYFNH